MKCINENMKSITLSLFWAGIILLGAYLSQGKDYTATTLIIAVSGWYISYHHFVKPNSASCCKKKSCANGLTSQNDGSK